MNRLAFSVGIVLTALAASPPGPAAAPVPDGQLAENPREICQRVAYETERRERIPKQLLAAISIVETGRWSAERKENFAWPWTVTSGGKGKYFPTKAAAIAEVRRIQGRGVANVDVGCMQVNLRYHADAFASLEEALDPRANVDYAARFLKELYRTNHSWNAAAAHYHSTNPDLNVPYRRKLMKVWNEERRIAADHSRARSLKAYDERRKRDRKGVRPSAPKRVARHIQGPLPRGMTGGKTLQDYRSKPTRTYRARGYLRAPYSRI